MHAQELTKVGLPICRDAGTTGAVGAVAPVAFCTHNFTGAVRVHKEAATGAQKL